MISLLNLTMAALTFVLTPESPCAARGDSHFPFLPYVMRTNLFDNIGVDGKYHFVYKTVNKANGKYYIGKHSTDDLNDGYLGSGTLLKKALKKYGKENFEREIICFCSSSEEVYAKEHEIVTQEIVNDPMSYNLRCGGEGAQKIYSEEEAKERRLESSRKSNIKYQQTHSEVYWESHRKAAKKYYQANKDRLKASSHAYQTSNRERHLEYVRAWRAKNREQQLEYKRAWRAKKKLEKENLNG